MQDRHNIEANWLEQAMTIIQWNNFSRFSVVRSRVFVGTLKHSFSRGPPTGVARPRGIADEGDVTVLLRTGLLLGCLQANPPETVSGGGMRSFRNSVAGRIRCG